MGALWVERVLAWWSGDDPSTLDDYDVAFLAGGPERVVLTAIAGLDERGAIRLSNSLGEAVLEQVSRRPSKDRLVRVVELAADSSLSAATEVAAGYGRPGPHPVERDVYQAIMHSGEIQPEALKALPTISALGERLGSFRRPKGRLVRPGLAVLALLLSVLLSRYYLESEVEPTGWQSLGSPAALIAAVVLWVWPGRSGVSEEIQTRRTAFSITGAGLRRLIDGRIETRPAAFPTMVALAGGAVVWAYAPDLAVATSGLSAPTRAELSAKAGGLGGATGFGGGGSGGDFGGGGGCGGGGGGCGGGGS